MQETQAIPVWPLVTPEQVDDAGLKGDVVEADGVDASVSEVLVVDADGVVLADWGCAALFVLVGKVSNSWWNA